MTGEIRSSGSSQRVFEPDLSGSRFHFLGNFAIVFFFGGILGNLEILHLFGHTVKNLIGLSVPA